MLYSELLKYSLIHYCSFDFEINLHAVCAQWQLFYLEPNPLHAKFFRRNKNIYLHFMSFLHIDMTQVVEVLPQLRQ